MTKVRTYISLHLRRTFPVIRKVAIGEAFMQGSGEECRWEDAKRILSRRLAG